jgi:two-component system sensor histidine kinase RegB
MPGRAIRAISLSPDGPWSPEAAGERNMRLVMQLRWLAVLGQLATILVVHYLLAITLPLVPMVAVLAWLVALNVVTRALMRWRAVGNLELMLALLLDVAALSAQLYMSGGATNPFVSLYLLQVVIGAVLLEPWSAWVMAAITSFAFGTLALFHRPLVLPPSLFGEAAGLQVFGGWINFVLAAILLVQFVTRIGRNLRARDAHLAEMRRRAEEEDHVVRIGLLASGAAHEISTPLASMSVILGDWKAEPAIAADPRLAGEVAEMQAEVGRCKDIVTGILYASGEVRGEAPARTMLRAFLTDIANAWDAIRPDLLTFEFRLAADLPIVADRTLAQVIGNVLDNAAEAQATRIRFIAERSGDALVLSVIDDGRGFDADILATLGAPYRTTKAKPGGGLGLFLAANVLRKLGGSVSAANDAAGGGAIVTLSIPLAAIALPTERAP